MRAVWKYEIPLGTGSGARGTFSIRLPRRAAVRFVGLDGGFMHVGSYRHGPLIWYVYTIGGD